VNLQFADSVEKKDRPIVAVPVEVWTYAPRGGLWTWAKETSGATDDAGRYETALPFRDPGITYALRVITSNGSALCCAGWAPKGFPAGTALIEPGTDVPGGKPVHLKASQAGDTVAFSYVFKDEWGSVFNVLDVLRIEADFVRRFETDVDSDRVGVAHIGLAGSGPSDVSWFDPVMYTMNITPKGRWQDEVLLHEYGHYLQAQIGTLAWMPSGHNGCTPATITVLGGNGAVVTTGPGNKMPAKIRGQHAWLEGFPDWLAETVYWSNSSAFAPKTQHAGKYLESASCPESGPWPDGDRFEYHVAAFLWDMTDGPSAAEPWDKDEGDAQIANIFRALDKEMDGADWPTIADLTIWYPGGATLPSASAQDIAIKNKVFYSIIN